MKLQPEGRKQPIKGRRLTTHKGSLAIAGLFVAMAVLAVPAVPAEEPAWGENSGRPSINQQLRDLKEQQHQKALEWQRKNVKQNWAQKLNGTYSDERVDETRAQGASNQSNLANIRRNNFKSNPNSAAPTLISPRGGGEFSRLSKGFDTSHSLKKEPKLGLNLGGSAGSSLHADKQTLKKETQGLGTGLGKGPGFSQNYGQQEYDPTAQ